MPDAKTLPAAARFYLRVLRHRKLRDAENLFAIEGPRSFLAAVENGFRFHTVIRSRILLRNSQTARQTQSLKESGARIANVSPECFRAICSLPRASGIAAIVERPKRSISSISVGSGLSLVVTRIRSAGNFGTLIRSAAAVGCDAVLTLGDKVDTFNPLVIRASMGAFFGIPIVQTCWSEFDAWTEHQRAEVVAADPSADRTHFEHRWRSPTILMLGDERAGLSSRQADRSDTRIRIPMANETDSLNVGVAGSVLMYEFTRVTGTLTNC